MDMLQRLVGGGQDRDQYQDFINRFEQGSPYDSITDDEAVDRYGQIAPSLAPNDFRDSAEDTFARLSPEERRSFARDLRTRARDRGMSVRDYDLNDDGIDDRMQNDPRQLADMTTRLRESDPNILEQLMGRGGTGGSFDNPIAKVAFAGIAAFAAQRLMGNRR